MLCVLRCNCTGSLVQCVYMLWQFCRCCFPGSLIHTVLKCCVVCMKMLCCVWVCNAVQCVEMLLYRCSCLFKCSVTWLQWFSPPRWSGLAQIRSADVSAARTAGLLQPYSRTWLHWTHVFMFYRFWSTRVSVSGAGSGVSQTWSVARMKNAAVSITTTLCVRMRRFKLQRRWRHKGR